MIIIRHHLKVWQNQVVTVKLMAMFNSEIMSISTHIAKRTQVIWTKQLCGHKGT